VFIQKLPAETAYVLLSLATTLCFGLAFAANTLYYATVVKLSPLELVLVGTALELSIFLFEVPTGVVADVISRRLSILVGFVLIGCGFMLEGMIASFLAVISAQILWGIGYTFTSGATQAWLSDEIGEAKANTLMLRTNVIERYLGLVVVPLAFILAFAGLQLPMIMGGIGFLLLALFLAFYMPENHFTPHPQVRNGVLAGMQATLSEAWQLAKTNTALRLVFIVTIILGAASESFDRLWQVHLLALGLPQLTVFFAPLRLSEAQGLLLLLAVIDLLITLLGLPLARWAARLDVANAQVVARALLWITAGLLLSLLGFALSPVLAGALLAYLAARILRGVHGSLSQTWLNQRLVASSRATVLSLNGQADAVGQMAGGPIIGALGNTSLRLALAAGAGILAVCLPLYASASRLMPASDEKAAAE
jgi:MFS transporter, DHA3 family, tetracycline resistance protein